MKADILKAMPLIRILNRYPNSFIPPQFRDPLKRIVEAMTAEGDSGNSLVLEWCEKQLRKTT